MRNFTTDTYETKRAIVNFSNKLTINSGQVEKKFIMNMIYGIAKTGSSKISSVSDALCETSKKINIEERLCRNLSKGISSNVDKEYLKLATSQLGDHPVLLVDDSDVVKKYGREFQSLGRVIDGSSKDKKIENGYYVSEIVGLTKEQKHPISLSSHIHSSAEPGYKSKNAITFKGLDQVIEALGRRATFVLDRGYDMNAMFQYMEKKKQNYIIRIKENRKLFFKGKSMKSATLRDSKKGKIKTEVFFRGENRTCYISHINCQITASKKNIYLVLVYGLGETPMMLATNCAITSKNDVVNILRTYMSRWRIEEYFRCKKTEYDFEDFRVRKLKAINALNKILSYVLGLLAILADKRKRSRLSQLLIERANAFKENVLFYMYQLSKGIREVLAYARTGVSKWQGIRVNEHCQQLVFKLDC